MSKLSASYPAAYLTQHVEFGFSASPLPGLEPEGMRSTRGAAPQVAFSARPGAARTQGAAGVCRGTDLSTVSKIVPGKNLANPICYSNSSPSCWSAGEAAK
jgi:hypothetical protein